MDRERYEQSCGAYEKAEKLIAHLDHGEKTRVQYVCHRIVNANINQAHMGLGLHLLLILQLYLSEFT